MYGKTKAGWFGFVLSHLCAMKLRRDGAPLVLRMAGGGEADSPKGNDSKKSNGNSNGDGNGNGNGNEIDSKGVLVVSWSYIAPLPHRTAGTVPIRILRSRSRDQVSMYSRSWRIQLSKSVLLRPLICQMQVMPGRTLKRRS